MRDAFNLKNFNFSVNGYPAEISDMWLTQNGEIYVSLLYNSVYLNVPVNNLNNYIIKSKTP